MELKTIFALTLWPSKSFVLRLLVLKISYNCSILQPYGIITKAELNAFAKNSKPLPMQTIPVACVPQIRSVNKSIKYVELLARTALGQDRQRLQDQLVSLHYKKQLICQAATTGASAKVRKSILQMRPEELDADTLLRTGVPHGAGSPGFAGPEAGGGGSFAEAGSPGHHAVGGGGGSANAEEERAAAMQIAAAAQHAMQHVVQQAAAGGAAGGGDQQRDMHSPAAAAAAAAAAVSQGSPYGMPPQMQMAGMAMGYSPYVHLAAAQAQQHAMAHQQQGEGTSSGGSGGGGGGGGGGGAGAGQASGSVPIHTYGQFGMYAGYPGMMGLPYPFQAHGYPGMPGYGVPGMGAYPSLGGGAGAGEHMTMGMSGMAAMQLAAQTMHHHHHPYGVHEQHEAGAYHEHQQRQHEAVAHATAEHEGAPTAPVNPRTPPPPETQHDAVAVGISNLDVNGNADAGRAPYGGAAENGTAASGDGQSHGAGEGPEGGASAQGARAEATPQQAGEAPA